jgi:hypothetical protein
MKRIITIAACLLASLAAVGSASAQDHAAKANIPFGFYVGNSWVPAGTYTMASESRSPDVVAIHNGDHTIALLSLGLLTDQQPGSNSLVFKKHGDQYFLHEIRCSACGMHVAFPATKRERNVEKREASVERPTDVYLALK